MFDFKSYLGHMLLYKYHTCLNNVDACHHQNYSQKHRNVCSSGKMLSGHFTRRECANIMTVVMISFTETRHPTRLSFQQNPLTIWVVHMHAPQEEKSFY